MDMPTQVQILDKVVYILHSTYTLRKGMIQLLSLPLRVNSREDGLFSREDGLFNIGGCNG